MAEPDDHQHEALRRALADLSGIGRVRVQATGDGVVLTRVGRGPVVLEVGASQYARCEAWLGEARDAGLEVREVGGSARVALGLDADEVIPHVLNALRTIDGEGGTLVVKPAGGSAQRW
ncbi:MAG: hypothetical protein R3F61_05635 [Myxococcota bacterium]